VTPAVGPGAQGQPLAALSLLPHELRPVPAEPASLLALPGTCDAVLVDARRELTGARALCRLVRATGVTAPVLVIVGEGGLVAVAADWGLDDVILDSAGPAEIDGRLRLAIGRSQRAAAPEEELIRRGDLLIDEAAYTVRLGSQALDLTYKEFELLRFLAQHPGRVFTRAQLLQEVWGFDYFGGTRTVDVHVRRLRAKLGVENEALIGTVRNVGYRFQQDRGTGARRASPPDPP